MQIYVYYIYIYIFIYLYNKLYIHKNEKQIIKLVAADGSCVGLVLETKGTDILILNQKRMPCKFQNKNLQASNGGPEKGVNIEIKQPNCQFARLTDRCQCFKSLKRDALVKPAYRNTPADKILVLLVRFCGFGRLMPHQLHDVRDFALIYRIACRMWSKLGKPKSRKKIPLQRSLSLPFFQSKRIRKDNNHPHPKCSMHNLFRIHHPKKPAAMYGNTPSLEHLRDFEHPLILIQTHL